MSPIDLLSFQRITATHGTLAGAAYFDPEESIVHDVFPDRIVFQTRFLDHSRYEVGVVDSELHVRKTRLDTYRRGHKAQVIDDEMDDEDWGELGSLWPRLSQDLDPEVQGPPLEVAETDDVTSVRARVSGHFPGSPVTLTFAFRLESEQIASLEIGA